MTLHPVNIANYKHCMGQEWFQPKEEHECSPEFIGSFSIAHREHYHYEDGV